MASAIRLIFSDEAVPCIMKRMQAISQEGNCRTTLKEYQKYITEMGLRELKRHDLLCPLSNNIMENPVALPCGHIFELVNIEKFLKENQGHCPRNCSIVVTKPEQLQPHYLTIAKLVELNQALVLKMQATLTTAHERGAVFDFASISQGIQLNLMALQTELNQHFISAKKGYESMLKEGTLTPMSFAAQVFELASTFSPETPISVVTESQMKNAHLVLSQSSSSGSSGSSPSSSSATLLATTSSSSSLSAHSSSSSSSASSSGIPSPSVSNSKS